VGLGVLGLLALGSSPGIRGFIEPDLNPRLMLISIVIAVGVGVVSGLYPAWRSSRLTPSLALQN
jgi:putative ABC transport system permease protein